MVTPEGGYVVAQPDSRICPFVFPPFRLTHTFPQSIMVQANRQVQRPFRGRDSRTSFEGPKHRLPYRPSHPPRRRQDALLRYGLLRGLHSDASARKGLHLSELCVQGGLAGQASDRQADAPEGRRLCHEGDRGKSEGRRGSDRERMHAGRLRLSGDDLPSPLHFLHIPPSQTKTHA